MRVTEHCGQCYFGRALVPCQAHKWCTMSTYHNMSCKDCRTCICSRCDGKGYILHSSWYWDGYRHVQY